MDGDKCEMKFFVICTPHYGLFRIRLVEHVASMGERRGAHSISVGRT